MSLKERYPDLLKSIQEVDDKNKNVRKTALVRLEKEILDQKEDLQNEPHVFLECNIFSKIYSLLGDENERIREMSAVLVLKLMNEFKTNLQESFFYNSVDIISERFSEGKNSIHVQSILFTW